MAQRTIYSCDWCGLESPKTNAIGELWVYGGHLDEHESQILCEICKNARLSAIENARRARLESEPDKQRLKR